MIRGIRGPVAGGTRHGFAVALSLVLLVALTACHPHFRESWVSSGDIHLTVRPAGGPGSAPAPVRLTFLGVAGWHIDTGRTELLTAPLLSNPGVLRVAAAPIASDTVAIARWLDAFGLGDLSGLDAILVGHAHYDHLLDVPWIAARRAPGARILGSATTRHTLAPFAGSLGLDTARVEVVTEAAATPAGGGQWLRVGPDLEVLPLRSDHGPHFDGITLYTGERTRDLEASPASAGDWIEGETLAFLIRIERPGGEDPLTILFRDAVARAPLGVPPDTLGPVDLALLVPATFQEVEWHPEAVLAAARPRHVILHHWEDFFEAPDTLDPAPVPFTPLGEFVGRLERGLARIAAEGAPEPRERWHLPVPGTVFVVR